MELNKDYSKNKLNNVSGAVARTDHKRRDNHAKKYYAFISNSKGNNDVRKIAVNTGFSEKDILKVKQHIFINEYNLGPKGLSKFTPDFDMAQSWQRLIEGINIKEMDIVLIKHELMELQYMESGMSYDEAHTLTSKKYSYQDYVDKLDEEGGVGI